mmetsp:Transcript_15790/g.48974  ORF Transcript_15790/g.48974 Transcript_15790/m.48974 type:complete len:392 (+) Transcript_15790:196-1371(+)
MLSFPAAQAVVRLAVRHIKRSLTLRSRLGGRRRNRRGVVRVALRLDVNDGPLRVVRIVVGTWSGAAVVGGGPLHLHHVPLDHVRVRQSRARRRTPAVTEHQHHDHQQHDDQRDEHTDHNVQRVRPLPVAAAAVGRRCAHAHAVELVRTRRDDARDPPALPRRDQRLLPLRRVAHVRRAVDRHEDVQPRPQRRRPRHLGNAHVARPGQAQHVRDRLREVARQARVRQHEPHQHVRRHAVVRRLHRRRRAARQPLRRRVVVAAAGRHRGDTARPVRVLVVRLLLPGVGHVLDDVPRHGVEVGHVDVRRRPRHAVAHEEQAVTAAERDAGARRVGAALRERLHGDGRRRARGGAAAVVGAGNEHERIARGVEALAEEDEVVAAAAAGAAGQLHL